MFRAAATVILISLSLAIANLHNKVCWVLLLNLENLQPLHHIKTRQNRGRIHSFDRPILDFSTIRTHLNYFPPVFELKNETSIQPYVKLYRHFEGIETYVMKLSISQVWGKVCICFLNRENFSKTSKSTFRGRNYEETFSQVEWKN